jgi:hypothetical protein
MQEIVEKYEQVKKLDDRIQNCVADILHLGADDSLKGQRQKNVETRPHSLSLRRATDPKRGNSRYNIYNIESTKYNSNNTQDDRERYIPLYESVNNNHIDRDLQHSKRLLTLALKNFSDGMLRLVEELNSAMRKSLRLMEGHAGARQCIPDYGEARLSESSNVYISEVSGLQRNYQGDGNKYRHISKNGTKRERLEKQNSAQKQRNFRKRDKNYDYVNSDNEYNVDSEGQLYKLNESKAGKRGYNGNCDVRNYIDKSEVRDCIRTQFTYAGHSQTDTDDTNGNNEIGNYNLRGNLHVHEHIMMMI